MTKVGGQGCGGGMGGHDAGNMANAHAFNEAMQHGGMNGDMNGGADHGAQGGGQGGMATPQGGGAELMGGLGHAGAMGGTGGGMASMGSMRMSGMSMSFSMSFTVRQQSQQVGQQAEGAREHLCGCTQKNQEFDTAQQQMGNVMNQLGQLIQQLLQNMNGSANGGGDTGMNQMQGLMTLLNTLTQLIQLMQQNATGGAQGGNQGANQGGAQGDFTAAINQLTQLLEMMQQIEDLMGQMQQGGLGQNQGQNQGAGNGQGNGAGNGAPAGQNAGQGGGQTGGQAGGQGGAQAMAGAVHINVSMNGAMAYGSTGMQQQNLNDLPEMAQGQWAAEHGGYTKTDGGYEVTQGQLAGHTLQWSAEINAFLVYDQHGVLCGKHSSQGGEHKVASPIAFDMNGDGKIGTTGQTTAKDGTRSELGQTVEFDIDGDGAANKIEWMSGDGDALLVDNRDGKAAGDMSGKRLFGDQGGKYSDGYQKLAQLDTNGDKQLTGAELDGLSLWQDNGDAQVQAGEMVSAKEAGITQISTERHDVKNDAGETLMRSQAEVAGKHMMTEDVWFGEDS